MADENKITYNINRIEDLLTLMNIYLEEWRHRDSMLWKQVFTYFFAILIVMIAPFANLNGFGLGDDFPKWLFPVVGIMLDLIYALVCYNYAVRLAAAGDAYSHIIDMLPENYRREKLKGKTLVYRMSYLLSIVLPTCLLCLGLLLLYASF